MNWIIAFVSVLVVMGMLDGAWLSFAVKRIYRPGIGHLMAEKPRPVPALIFYLLYAAGVTYLIVLPALAGGGWTVAATHGAVLGLIAYGTYDLTSLAILRGWPVRVTVLDIIWGAILTGAAAAISVLVTARFG